MATEHLKIVSELVFETSNLLLQAPAIFLSVSRPEAIPTVEGIDRIVDLLRVVIPLLPKASPDFGDCENIIAAGIAHDARLKGAFANIIRFGPVQVEKQIAGFDCRITFISDKLVGVLQILPANLCGDGVSTVRQVLEADPVNPTGAIIGKVIIDDEVREHMRAAGIALDEVLAEGRRNMLRRWWRSRDDHSLKDLTAALILTISTSHATPRCCSAWISPALTTLPPISPNPTAKPAAQSWR